VRFWDWTKLITASCIGILLVWTSIAVRFSPNDTVSELVRSTAHDQPMIPFLMGVFIGHWLFSMGARPKDEDHR
jgi:hypothetical protein